MSNMKCPNCGTRLSSLYYRKREGKKRSWIKIESLYCKKCKMPTKLVELNWFKE